MTVSLVCGDCGTAYTPTIGHCRGGRYDGCCSSFKDKLSADSHRVGKFNDGTRRCLTVDERVAEGWTLTDGFWVSPKAAEAAAKYKEYREAVAAPA